MLLSGCRDLMGPLDSLDGYYSSLAVLGCCSLRVTGKLSMSSCAPVSECILLCSVSISVNSIYLLALPYGSLCMSCYQLKLAAQPANLQSVVAAEVEATNWGLTTPRFTQIHILLFLHHNWPTLQPPQSLP